MKRYRFTHIIRPTFISTYALVSTLAISSANADVFDELDAETSDYGSYEEPAYTSSDSDYSASTADDNSPTDNGCADIIDEFERWKCNEEAEFSSWKEAYFAELEAYKSRVLDVWDEAEITDKTSWVEYSDDLKTKKVVDYENNEIRISVAASDTPLTQEQIQKYVEEIISTTPNEARKNDPVLNAIGGGEASSDTASNTSLLDELKQAPPAAVPPAPASPVVTEPAPEKTVTAAEPIQTKPSPAQQPATETVRKPTIKAKPEAAKPAQKAKPVKKAKAAPTIAKAASASAAAAQLATTAVTAKKPSKKLQNQYSSRFDLPKHFVLQLLKRHYRPDQSQVLRYRSV